MDDREQRRRPRRPPWWLATAVLVPAMVLFVAALRIPFPLALFLSVVVTIAVHAIVRYRMLNRWMRESRQ